MKRKALIREKVIIGIALLLIIVPLLGSDAVLAQAPKPYKGAVHVEIRTAKFGGTSFILGFALADILNKKHPTIMASALETNASVDNFKRVGPDPKLREKTMFMCSSSISPLVEQCKKPFNDPELCAKLKGWKVITTTQGISQTFCTLDPKIKSMADVAGKKVSIFPKATTKGKSAVTWLDAYGLLDKIKLYEMGWAGIDALVDGTVDVAFFSTGYRGKDKWSPLPKCLELIKKRKTYIIPITQEAFKFIEKKYGSQAAGTTVWKKDACAPGVPAQDTLVHAVYLAWLAYPDFKDKIAYEVIKTMDENRDLMVEYHPVGGVMDPTWYGRYPVPKNYWHPGVRKYYDEKGIKYGTD